MRSLDDERIEVLLRDAPWIREVDPDLGRELLKHARVIARARGEWFYAEGDPATGLFIVLEGLVRVSCAAPGGLTYLIGQAGPGAILGQSVRFGGGPRLHTLICAQDSVVLGISDGVIADIATHRPDVWKFVISVIYRQLEGVVRVLTQTLALPPRQRIAARLCMFADANGVISISQAELAETLGLTRKTVNGHLASFQRDGLIDCGYGKISLLELERLKEIGDTDGTHVA
jgi:CRP/FNR family transcriptional regulator, cyclic AMP receptor protein